MEEIATADAIVTMAHGLLKNGKPSRGDMVFAVVMRYLHERFPWKPLIPQEPVALAAPDIPFAAIAKPPKGNALGGSNMAWNSRTVAGFQAGVCRENGWKTVALIAAPWTQPRAKWELERYGLKVVVVPMPPFSKKLYGDANSIGIAEAVVSATFQWRVRGDGSTICRIGLSPIDVSFAENAMPLGFHKGSRAAFYSKDIART